MNQNGFHEVYAMQKDVQISRSINFFIFSKIIDSMMPKKSMYVCSVMHTSVINACCLYSALLFQVAKRVSVPTVVISSVIITHIICI